MGLDDATRSALDAMTVGDALGAIPAPVQAAVLALLLLTALWALHRPRTARVVAFVACALMWSRANHAFEGQILLVLTADHGVTTADLPAPALALAIAVRGWPGRPAGLRVATP
jgi:hypothetical protein